MMNLMERAAEAAYLGAGGHHKWAELPLRARTTYLNMVREALLAVRVPSRTEQVWLMDGRLIKCTPDVAENWRQEYERTWIAMIDAILVNAPPAPESEGAEP